MSADDPLDELASSVSDGLPVDWDDAAPRAEAERAQASFLALRDLARIAEFSRALQRSDPGGGSPPANSFAPAAPSIAVLPFLNRSLDEADASFADGLADELLHVLSKIRGIRVAARTSSLRFQGGSDDLDAIGRKLHVATILEGSVRKSGPRVRVSVRLVNVSDGHLIWSETYDRTLDDTFAVQDDIARRVVEELRAALLPAPSPDTPPRDSESGPDSGR